MSAHARRPGVRLTLPATSANLGPGFDAVGLALSLSLRVEAHPTGHTSQPPQSLHSSIEATGRDVERMGTVGNNLILQTYSEVLRAAGRQEVALRLVVENQIPLGMGCGSSAAARLAGVALANHFGELEMTDASIVAEASRREGHPDNVAACWYGGFTVSVPVEHRVEVATVDCDGTWQLVLALPSAGLATEEARAVLPKSISFEDAVFNVQRMALLTAAFAQQRLDLLSVAMEDRLHQPHRKAVCGLLTHLHHLQGAPEFAGVALSGAGPALLGVLSERATLHAAEERMRRVLGDDVELLPVRIGGPAQVEVA